MKKRCQTRCKVRYQMQDLPGHSHFVVADDCSPIMLGLTDEIENAQQSKVLLRELCKSAKRSGRKCEGKSNKKITSAMLTSISRLCVTQTSTVCLQLEMPILFLKSPTIYSLHCIESDWNTVILKLISAAQNLD